MTRIYLAYNHGRRETLTSCGLTEKVNILVALNQWEQFEKIRDQIPIDKLCLDSGAFAAMNSGFEVTYESWFEIANSKQHDEIFALDVIGDAEASFANFERSLEDELYAIPTFHISSDLDHLKRMCKDKRVEKIALGGMVRHTTATQRREWLKWCFNIAWPRKIHAFGVTDEKTLSMFPFHSCDSSTWSLGPAAFGNYRSFGGKIPARKMRDFRCEVFHYLKLQRKLEGLWSTEMKQFNE